MDTPQPKPDTPGPSAVPDAAKLQLKRRAAQFIREYYAADSHGDKKGRFADVDNDIRDHATLLSDASESGDDADVSEDDGDTDTCFVDADVGGELAQRDITRFRDVLKTGTVSALKKLHRGIAPKGADRAWMDRAKRYARRKLRRHGVTNKRVAQWEKLAALRRVEDLRAGPAWMSKWLADTDVPLASDDDLDDDLDDVDDVRRTKKDPTDKERFDVLRVSVEEALEAHAVRQVAVDEEAVAAGAGRKKDVGDDAVTGGYPASVASEDIDTDDADRIAGHIVDDDHVSVSGSEDEDDRERREAAADAEALRERAVADAVVGDMDKTDARGWWVDTTRQAVAGTIAGGAGVGHGKRPFRMVADTVPRKMWRTLMGY